MVKNKGHSHTFLVPCAVGTLWNPVLSEWIFMALPPSRRTPVCGLEEALLVPLQCDLLREPLVGGRDVGAAMAAQSRFDSFAAHHGDVAGDAVVRPDAVL